MRGLSYRKNKKMLENVFLLQKNVEKTVKSQKIIEPEKLK